MDPIRDLGPLPEVTELEETYQQAERDLKETIFQWKERHRLTPTEILTALNEISHGILASCQASERRALKGKRR